MVLQKPTDENVNEPDSGGWGRKRKKWDGRWSHLDADKRAQYEAIEERVREKVRRGEL